jgi:hypothetical protein
MRSLALAWCCLATIACGTARAAASTSPGHSGRWITDASGRVVIVHGINMVYKLPLYDPAAAGFGDDDAAFLASIGFDTVRVGVILVPWLEWAYCGCSDPTTTGPGTKQAIVVDPREPPRGYGRRYAAGPAAGRAGRPQRSWRA